MSNPGMMEGLGGPVDMDPFSIGGIDPALEDCCRREVSDDTVRLSLYVQYLYSSLTVFYFVFHRSKAIVHTMP
jgi:hypothetical protein